jgi:hypothetical protein
MAVSLESEQEQRSVWERSVALVQELEQTEAQLRQPQFVLRQKQVVAQPEQWAEAYWIAPVGEWRPMAGSLESEQEQRTARERPVALVQELEQAEAQFRLPLAVQRQKPVVPFGFLQG